MFLVFLRLIPTTYLPQGFFDLWDKAQNALAFFCLSSLGILAYQKAVVKVAIGLLLYGAWIEVLQWLTGWRSGGPTDWAADGIGVLIGCPLIKRLIQKRSIFLNSRL